MRLTFRSWRSMSTSPCRHAFQAQQRGNRRRRHACWPAPVSAITASCHCVWQQSLAERVVNFVRAGVQQVFALEINLRPAQRFREPLGEIERRRPSRVVGQQRTQLGLERRIRLGFFVGVLQFVQRSHQRLRHVAPAIDAEAPGRDSEGFAEE